MTCTPRAPAHLAILSCLLASACTTYNCVAQADGDIYLTGSTNFLIFGESWVRRCSPSPNSPLVRCEDVAVIKGVPERMARALGPAAIPEPQREGRLDVELQVVTEPPGLDVFVDGRRVGTGPWREVVEPGMHDVVVGGRCLYGRERVAIEARGLTELRLLASEGKQLLELQVEASDLAGPAVVRVDGFEVGSAPGRFLVSPCAAVSVAAPGRTEWSKTLTAADLDGPVQVRLPPLAPNPTTTSLEEQAEWFGVSASTLDAYRMDESRSPNQTLAGWIREKNATSTGMLVGQALGVGLATAGRVAGLKWGLDNQADASYSDGFGTQLTQNPMLMSLSGPMVAGLPLVALLVVDELGLSDVDVAHPGRLEAAP